MESSLIWKKFKSTMQLRRLLNFELAGPADQRSPPTALFRSLESSTASSSPHVTSQRPPKARTPRPMASESGNASPSRHHIVPISAASPNRLVVGRGRQQQRSLERQLWDKRASNASIPRRNASTPRVDASQSWINSEFASLWHQRPQASPSGTPQNSFQGSPAADTTDTVVTLLKVRFRKPSEVHNRISRDESGAGTTAAYVATPDHKHNDSDTGASDTRVRVGDGGGGTTEESKTSPKKEHGRDLQLATPEDIIEQGLRSFKLAHQQGIVGRYAELLWLLLCEQYTVLRVSALSFTISPLSSVLLFAFVAVQCLSKWTLRCMPS